MAQPPSDVARELTALDAELKRLEAEYNMFFAGRLPRPPWETRGRVEAAVKRLDRMHISNTGERFRFATIHARFAAFVDLWDRGLRAREEGRPGPFARTAPKAKPAARPEDRILRVTTFSDPLGEPDKLRDLYDSMADARRELGQRAIPFQKFADLIKTQVGSIKAQGGSEVAFRVAMKDGKVSLTARALKGTGKA